MWNIIEISDDSYEFLKTNLCLDFYGEVDEDDEEVGKDNNYKINNDKNKKINKNDDNIKKIVSQNRQITKENLDTILDNLFQEDPFEKLRVTKIIDENICNKYEQNKDILIPNIDKIITTFNLVLNKLFNKKDLNPIQIRLAENISTVFFKVAKIKELISHLSYNILIYTIRELLLQYFLIQTNNILDERNMLMKLINSTIKQIITNCDITFVISALLELIKESQENDKNSFINLVICCLIEVENNLSENFDDIKISEILLKIHLLLLSIQKKNEDLNQITQIDDIIINIIKDIIIIFVQYKKERILEEYSKLDKNHQVNDIFLLNLIKAELEKVLFKK